MSNGTIKEAALELVQSLPEDCTWDDVAYRISVRQKIEAGKSAQLQRGGRFHTTRFSPSSTAGIAAFEMPFRIV